MKPESYLTDLGLEYFYKLEAVLKSYGMDNDGHSVNLSILANEYASYHECAEKTKGVSGKIQILKGTYTQINAYHTIARDSLAAISRLSAKFGLTPFDFSKMGNEKKDKPKENKMDKFKVSHKKQA